MSEQLAYWFEILKMSCENIEEDKNALPEVPSQEGEGMNLIPVPIELPAWITDLLTKLVGPVFEEVGLSLRDQIRMFRGNRQIRFLEEFSKKCSATGIALKAVKMSLLCDILEKASLEDDDELQDLWANLLVNAADSREQVLVRTAFPEILKQISKEEALYLLELFEVAQQTEMHVLKMNYFDFAQDEQQRKFKLDQVSYDNLKRLGLIELNTDTVPAVARTLTKEEIEGGNRNYKLLTEEEHLLSSLGYAFVLACQTPKAQSESSNTMTAVTTS